MGWRSWIKPDLLPSIGEQPDWDVEQLGWDVPVALYPARLETRFDRVNSKLLVRIYPDEILVEEHEPSLTEDELAAGKQYWIDAWRGTLETQQAAWQNLLQGRRHGRAGWVVRETTPTNIAKMSTEEPLFDDPRVLRAHSWTRPAEARLLPDRWVVMTYRDGTRIHRQFTSVVEEPLAATISPDPAATGATVAGGLTISDEVAWAYDFDRAVDSGMALRLSLSSEDLDKGFDQVIALGVKPSMGAESSSENVNSLFEGHRCARGMEFLQQGAPTNNSDLGGSLLSTLPVPESFALEVNGSALGSETDGARLAKAFGFTVDPLTRVRGANRTEDANARAMQRVLWRASVGYFLEQMMDPVLSQEEIADAREFYLQHVRARGTFSAFRIGRVPYGVLPVSNLSQWVVAENANFTSAGLPAIVRGLKAFWREQISNVPRAGASNDADKDLLEAMGLDATSREARVRQALGPSVTWNLAGFSGLSGVEWSLEQRLFSQDVLNAIGHPTWPARVLGFSFGKKALLWDAELVGPAPLSRVSPLQVLEEVWGIPPNELRSYMPAYDSLFFHVLRHALINEYERATAEFHVQEGVISSIDPREPEMVGMTQRALDRGTAWENLTLEVNGFVPGDDVLLENPIGDGDLAEVAGEVEKLMALPEAEIDGLFSEVLDLSSHRYDAWVSSLFAERLWQMRDSVSGASGIRLGAFAWLEDLRPKAPPTTRMLPDSRVANVASDGGGYVHAPSLEQAATSAVLRNAFMTRKGEEKGRFALSLTSRRVRTAQDVLDAVRQGQSLGAVLGYLFERRLHEDGADQFIEPFRAEFPQVADKAMGVVEDAVAKAARGTLDGLAAAKAWAEEGVDIWDRSNLSTQTSYRERAEAALTLLGAAVDATSDVLLAEAVHQVVRGNASTASASFDALAKGARPPETAFIRTPRTGTSHSHRVLFALPDAGIGSWSSPWSSPPTPKATAQEALNRWIGSLLGPASKAFCQISYESGGSTVVDLYDLESLQIQPIDLLGLATPGASAGLPQELVLRFSKVVLDRDSSATNIELEPLAPGKDPDHRSLQEVLEIARSVRAILAGRPLTPSDLAPPESEPLQGQGLTPNSDSVTRATTAGDDLESARVGLENAVTSNPLDVEALRSALISASNFGISNSYPRTAFGTSPEIEADLLAQGSATLAEIARRQQACTAIDVDEDPRGYAKAIFGADFPFLVGFKPGDTTELQAAFANRSTIGAQDEAVRAWVQQTARVREPIGRWRRLALVQEVLQLSFPFNAVQLPNDGAPWVALPNSGAPPASGKLSLVMHLPEGIPTGDWQGLYIDGWSELVPGEKQMTGVTFHYDDPGAEAAHTVLLLVPPQVGRGWSLDGMAGALLETLELAKMRAVDGELLDALGQLRPGLYVPSTMSEPGGPRLSSKLHHEQS